MRNTKWVEGYEANDLSVFKNFLFIGQRFVVLSLIVATKIYQNFISLNIIHQDIQ